MRALPDILKEAVEGVPNCQYNVAYMKDHLGWANEVELIWYAAERKKLADLCAVALTFRIFPLLFFMCIRCTPNPNCFYTGFYTLCEMQQMRMLFSDFVY
jgi:hypothetical protein